jgi:hypothetical protein
MTLPPCVAPARPSRAVNPSATANAFRRGRAGAESAGCRPSDAWAGLEGVVDR